MQTEANPYSYEQEREMVCERLHVICGNCGCSDDFTYKIEPAYDNGPGDAYEDDVWLTCNNCATIHTLSDNAKLEPNHPVKQEE
jgi:hypothetical protein